MIQHLNIQLPKSRMKRFTYIIGVFLALVVFSCQVEPIEAGFEGLIKQSILDYLIENEAEYSSFLSILEKGGIDKMLAAHNPGASGYTLFLPGNDAVDEFIQQRSEFSSLQDLLNNEEYVNALSRYHVLDNMFHSNEFPFGAFPDATLSEDYLTVSFIIEEDTSYYKINNQAAVSKPNREVSNGYIHIIESMLSPAVYTSYEWLAQNPNYSIFKEAIDMTGISHLIDFNLKKPGMEYRQPVTLFVEPDNIFQQNGINSAQELAKMISPENNNYKDSINPFYNFMAYHVLYNLMFIDEFVEISSNYNTYSDAPLSINGLGVDISINKGKTVFDTIIVDSDSTFIDYIGFLYDESNVTTQSGAIHMIDRIMEQQIPSRLQSTFQFREEPFIMDIRRTIGTFQIEEEKKEFLTRLDWNGADLYFVREGEESYASNDDYLQINGDFTISYKVPRIVQGNYKVILRAESYSSTNAVVEVFVDGKKIGSMADLTRGGTAKAPFQSTEMGTITFNEYKEHLIEIKPVVPGNLSWDYIRFDPN